MSALTDLLVRLEAAEGADRELDSRIVVTFDLRPEWLGDSGTLWLDTKERRPAVRYLSPGLRRSQGNPPLRDDEIPPFTASLDASLALVERVLPGTFLILDTRALDTALPVVVIGEGKKPLATSAAKTPALAVLVAMVKALIARDFAGSDT